MAKKKFSGAIVEIDLPPAPQEPAPEKKKREISEKQRENLSKGLAALKAKREAKAKSLEVVTPEEPTPPPAPIAPVAVQQIEQPKVKERKPRVVKNYLTTEDFNSFKTELLTTLKPAQPAVLPLQLDPRPIMSPVAAPKERVISGRELLDKIFFK